MRRLLSALLCLAWALPSAAQTPAPPSTPQSYPYTFANFIWWSDADLRAALKQKLPSLGDELVPYSSLDEKVRRALTELLTTKGIHADVLSIEPAHSTSQPPMVDNIAIGVRASKLTPPNMSRPKIVYKVLPPPNIKIGKVTTEGAPPGLESAINQWTQYLPDREYEDDFTALNLNVAGTLQDSGYFSGTSEVIPGTYEKTDDDLYLVPLTIKITPGPHYHIGSIKADGGPLFKGIDLTGYIPAHKGDVVVLGLSSRLAYSLRDAYHQAGYAYAEVNDTPILDRDRALASYNITVDPGPLYHFRKLTILHLDPTKEQAVRKLLDMKPGDVYNSTLAMTLQRKLQMDPSFAGLRFSFGANADEKEHQVDLTLDFFKE